MGNSWECAANSLARDTVENCVLLLKRENQPGPHPLTPASVAKRSSRARAFLVPFLPDMIRMRNKRTRLICVKRVLSLSAYYHYCLCETRTLDLIKRLLSSLWPGLFFSSVQ